MSNNAYTPDSLDFSATGSRILSFDSPAIPSEISSKSGPGDDFSLSELSLFQHDIMRKPFSLLAKSEPAQLDDMDKALQKDENDDNNNDDEVFLDNTVIQESNKQQLREQKLQSDLVILKKLNASFELFNDALRDTGSANERVASQLEQTDALLNKYIGILSKSEDFSRLIFDEQWQGAVADEQIVEEQMRQEKERTRREAEEAAIRLEQESQRLEQQKLKDLKREEKERLERDKSEKALQGVRGVRGTRASMRGVRGANSSRIAQGAGRGTSRSIK